MARYLAAAIVLAVAGIAVQARQQPAAESARRAAPQKAESPSPEANLSLAKEQLALADAALEIQHALARSGRLPMDDPSFAVWGRRRLEALRRTGAGKAEMIAALEKHIETLKADEAIARTMREQARATEGAVMDVRFRRLEAEIWLNEERAR